MSSAQTFRPAEKSFMEIGMCQYAAFNRYKTKEKTREIEAEEGEGRMKRTIEGAIRCIHTAAESPRLKRFSLQAPKSVEVAFDNGTKYSLSAEYLRIYSPAADSRIRSIAGEKVIYGRRHVGIMSAEPVGNYGVRLFFDDLHKTGIFTWEYFYYLGSNKFSLMRDYIRMLKKHGLNRDPPRKK